MKSLVKHLKESKIKEKYQIYHKTYTSAINTALEYAQKQGYEYDEEETSQKIGLGPGKPKDGKTNKVSIELIKNGKLQKVMLHIQVYNMGIEDDNANTYELNCYVS